MYSRKDKSEISELYSVKDDPHEIIAGVMGPNFLKYRKSWEKAVNFKHRLKYPLHIDFEISYRCNYRCRMCVFSLPKEEKERYGNPAKRLTFEVFKKIIDEGVILGLSSVGFNGLNEPLLEKDLIKWIKYARKKQVLDIMFNTNGLLLTDSISEELIRSGLTRIMVSIDAATEKTYRITRPAGDYFKVIKNVENFIKIRNGLKKKLPILRVSFVKMKSNIHELDRFIRMWKDKVDFFSIQSYGNPLLPGERYYEDFDKHHLEKNTRTINFKCPQPWVRLMVRHNGDINPCCGIQGPKLVFGNVYRDNIKDVWNSKKMQFLRSIHEKGEYKKNRVCQLCADSLHVR